MAIREIAHNLNALCDGYRIGNLQSIRENIKGLSRNPGGRIFRDSTISDDGWAFHYGGRKELQFNIGFEQEGLRYGVAFSLEPSQTLPDVSILYPKVLRFNCIIQEKSEFFHDYQMWYWRQDRSEISKVSPISPELINPPTFIFVGKIETSSEIDYHKILKTFDELLEFYISVETDYSLATSSFHDQARFTFGSNIAQLPLERTYSTEEKEVCADIRHSLLQSALATELSCEFGKDNVSIENPFAGNKIDVVLKTDNGFHFYEVKVASSAKACIRQAVGQLLEYGFWPGTKHAAKIIVAGEHPVVPEAESYINFLQTEFHLPIDYVQISL